jgi:D-glycero-D-manno-heptose 1,7-bisphosphate phosphatase
MNRAVFLDRDGVINRKPREGEYVTRWEEMEILPGVAEGIILLNRAGFDVIVVTNQRCIAKALLTRAEMESIHERMCRTLGDAGATIDAVYFCPHEKQPPCACRKPAPGMLLLAAREHGIDLTESWMIGDSDIDVAAGKAAGCKTARLVEDHEATSTNADVISTSLLDALNKILQKRDLPLFATTRNTSRI